MSAKTLFRENVGGKIAFGKNSFVENSHRLEMFIKNQMLKGILNVFL